MAPTPPPPAGAGAVVVKRGMISRLECENFKSYKGHQVIGPFKQFTSIVGPNGSGKSNLMDAISFVLGVQSEKLRGAKMKDLVYTFDLADKAANASRGASVKLMFDTEDGAEVVFSRHITAAGAGEYRIDDRVCTAEAYNDRLKDFGILVKARNFLVFQGDIESVASKSPKDLTALIENVSGSEELKKDYDGALRDRHRCEDEQHAAFTKRKGLATQKKTMKEQKDEAEKHMRMQEELRQMRVEHVLFRLFHIDADVERHGEEIEQAAEALTTHEARVETCGVEMEEKRKLKATHSKQAMMLERKVAKHRADADARAPSTAKTKEETLRAKKKLELAGKLLEKHAADAAACGADVQRLEADLANVHAAQAAFEAEIARDIAEGGAGGGAKKSKGSKKQKMGAGPGPSGAASGLDLGAAQIEAYHRKKEEAGAQTYKLQQELNILASARRDDESVRSRHASKRGELEGRLAALNQQRDAELVRLAHLKEKEDTAQAQLAEARGVEKTAADEKRKSRAKTEHFNTKIEELSGKLREAKADRKESDREVRAREAVASLKRLLPGVRGRVTDLMQVSQKKYNLAVITVLGREADAVVVEDSKVAKECIQYLKEQRIESMTFLPLKELKVLEPDERLRRLGGTAKLCLDVVNFDPAVQRAMVYALGNDTVVCDGHAEAKAITFGGNARIKVVSVDGTLIKKSGEMTGGSSGSLEAKAARFDAAEVEQLRADRQAAEGGLAQLRPVQALAHEEAEAAARLAQLERDLRYGAADAAVCAEKAEKLRKEVAAVEREVATTLPDLAAAEKACARAAAEVAALETRIHDMEDAVYADFSASVGVANIREYEAHNLATLQRAAEERAKFTQQRATLTEHLNFERSRDTEGPRAKAEADIAKHAAELERLTRAAAAARAETEASKDVLDAWERDVAAAKSEAEAVEAEVKELRRQHGSLGQEGARLQRAVGGKTAAVEALREQRADLIAAARMERLKLPRAQDDEGGAGDEDVLALPGPESGSGDDDDDDDNMDVDDGGSKGGGGGAGGGGGWRAAAFRARLDYDSLPPRLKQVPRASERTRMCDELRAAADAKAAALARLEPNMKAIHQYEGIKEKERAQVEDLEGAHQRARAAADLYAGFKNQRTAVFTAAFTHIAAAIDRVYKELTHSEAHPLGGTAYLSLESPDEPYNHGVKFTAMPPTKRFRDMDQLSGGEKTMAALALLFAIHSYRSAPFFVLDEVDSALDKTNVEKMAAFIRARSHGTGAGSEGRPCQSIVISLKDDFFDKADSMVGVCRDVHAACSRVFTFDLTPYEE